MKQVRTIIAESFDSVAEIGQEIGAPQWIIDRIADEQMYNASMYRNLHAVRKHGANAPEEARRIIEASDLEKELRLRHLEKQRSVLKRLRNERTMTRMCSTRFRKSWILRRLACSARLSWSSPDGSRSC